MGVSATKLSKLLQKGVLVPNFMKIGKIIATSLIYRLIHFMYVNKLSFEKQLKLGVEDRRWCLFNMMVI